MNGIDLSKIGSLAVVMLVELMNLMFHFGLKSHLAISICFSKIKNRLALFASQC